MHRLSVIFGDSFVASYPLEGLLHIPENTLLSLAIWILYEIIYLCPCLHQTEISSRDRDVVFIFVTIAFSALPVP